MNRPTVATLIDVLTRAQSVIEESADADEHAELLAELRATVADLERGDEPAARDEDANR